VFAVIAPAATAIAVLVFIGTIYATRFVSAGSMAAALVLPVAAAAANAPQPVVSGAMLSAAVVAVRHRENVMRLLAGTERRIGLRL
jgi:glycerol-3-phosphate acyltransferase PlsY